VPEYDFHTLSPMDFELLVRDLLQERLDIELQAFGHGPDGGVDLRSSDNGKTTIVQCKHYRGSSFSDLKAAAKKEKPKMDKVKPDDYYFVTSQDLSLTQQEALVTELSPYLIDTNTIFAMRDLNQMLGQFPNVEQNHFKLWMASAGVIRQIVQSGLWQRSEALMEEIQDRVRLYVATPSFAKASRMLADKSVCVITGAPGVGKSMLADMLALSRWESGWRIIGLASQEINKAWDAWQGEGKQFFYFDDVFGQTDIQERLSNDSGTTVARLIHRIGVTPKKELVITTRTHVLQEAEYRDEPIARARLHARECVVEVTEYSKVDRARILYNHLYFSELPRDLIREFATHDLHLQVIDHPNFTPRLIEQTIIQQDGEGTARDLLERMILALDHPIQLWGPSFREALTEPARKILLHLVTFPTHGAPLTALQAVSIRDATPIDYQKALTQLEGSWITIVADESGNGSVVTFHNPSCRDFVLSFIDAQPEYALEILQNSTRSAQISQLIRYADAIGRGSAAKYPALDAAVGRNSEQIAEIIRNTWDGEPSVASDYAAAALNSFRVADDKYQLGLGDWIIEQAMVLSERIDGPGKVDGDDAEDLARAIVDSGRTPSTPQEVLSCKYLFLGWCDAVGHYDEWDEVFGFSEWLENVAEVPWTSEDDLRLQNSFERWLESEFEGTLENAEDPHDARDWAEKLRAVTHKYFGSALFDRWFSEFDRAVGHKFGDDYEPSWEEIEAMEAADAEAADAIESSSETSLGTFDFIRSEVPGISEEDAEIRALFDQLE
jgi:hypothetical protein